MAHHSRSDNDCILNRRVRDQADRRKAIHALLVSSACLFGVGLFEFLVAVAARSAALFSDALHNLGDVLTTLALYVGFRLSCRSPNARYPYGYGRAEDLAGIGVVIAIWVSAVLAGLESLEKLRAQGQTTLPLLGLAAALAGVIGNQAVARYKLQVGREINSEALVADSRHAGTDALASAGAVVGLAGVAAGFPLADPVAGCAITVIIVRIGLVATRDVVTHLLDAQDEAITKAVHSSVAQICGIRQARDVRTRWIGRQLAVQLVVDLPKELTVREAHVVARAVEASICDVLPQASDVVVRAGLPQAAAPAPQLPCFRADEQGSDGE